MKIHQTDFLLNILYYKIQNLANHNNYSELLSYTRMLMSFSLRLFRLCLYLMCVTMQFVVICAPFRINIIEQLIQLLWCICVCKVTVRMFAIAWYHMLFFVENHDELIWYTVNRSGNHRLCERQQNDDIIVKQICN